MAQLLFPSEDAITNDWLTYIEQEAKSLAQSDEFTIENYADRELLNPEVKAYLLATYSVEDNAPDDVAYTKDINFDIQGQESVALSFEQNRALSGQATLFGWWKRIKEVVRKVFCEVAATISGDGDIDWKDTIKLILVALIPAFGSGVPAIVLPILIALLAALMKYGYNKVCPVV